jgi:putative ABC transport system permease protein
MTLWPALRLNLRYYRRRRLLAALCLTGISLGVGIVVAVKLINDSAFSSLSSSVDLLSGRATHSVVSSHGRIPEKLFRAIWTNPLVKAAAPVIEESATTLETGADPIRFVGLDPLMDAQVRDLTPEGADAREFTRFLTSATPCAYLSADLMKRFKLKTGDTLTVLIAGMEHRVRILGSPRGSAPAGLGEKIAVLDIAAAQEIFGRVGYLDRIDLVVEGSPDRLAAELPDGLKLTDRSERKSALRAMLYSFQLNLAAMSLLALFTGVFLIYNFSMFSVLARREQMSLLLTLGCDRREIVGAFLAEAAILALFGSILGIVFGYLVASLSVDMVSSSISELYFHLRIGLVRLTPSVVMRGLGVGFAATLAGAALPALETAATPPIVGMKRRTIEDRAHGLKGLLLIGGAVCLVCAFAAAWASRFSVFWGFASAFGITLAFALFTPSFLSPFAHYSGIVLRRVFGSLEGFLGARTVGASLSRTSIAVAALAVALSMTIGVDGMIYGFRRSVVNWLEGTLYGDLYIAPETTKWAHPLPSELMGFLRSLPEVEAIERYSTHPVSVDGKTAQLRIVDGEVLKDHSSFHFLAGKKQAWERLMKGGVFVSESLRYRLGIHAGENAIISTPQGRRAFPVVSVIRDYSTDRGAVHMDRAVYESIWNNPQVQSVAVFLKPGASRLRVRRAIVRRYPGLDRNIVSNSEMKRNILAIFDKTFAPTATLKGVSLLVALLGVATALAAILLERSRESAVLGYLGLTPRELAGMNVYQALVMGAAAYPSAVLCGVILTYVIVHAINFRSFGWSVDVFFSPWLFLKTFLLTMGACLAASIHPSLRVLRSSRSRVLEEE